MKLSAKWLRLVTITVGIILCGIIAYQVDATTGATKIKYQSVKGLVTDSHNRPIVGATVYFIDSSTASLTTPYTPAKFLVSGVATSLEDIVTAAAPKSLPYAVTNKAGEFGVKKLNGSTTYFPFVVPAATDTNHLPGGDLSRVAFAPKKVGKGGLHIQLSWQVPSTSTYIGTTACYVCHSPSGGAIDATACKATGHSLLFHPLGGDTANQNSAAHPGSSWDQLAQKFVPSSAYNKPFSGTAMEVLHFQDYNQYASNSFNIYESTTATAVAPTPEYLQAYLWVTSNANPATYNVTLVNVINPSDPNSPMTLPVPMTVGGYIRQGLLAQPKGFAGLYPLIRFQAITGSTSQGLMTNYERSRKIWADSGLGAGVSSFFVPNKTTPNKSLLATTFLTVPPPTGTTFPENITCAVCHLGFSTFTSYTNPTTTETLGTTVSDPNGFDLGGNGQAQDIGVDCEQCHGPGSAHRAQNLQNIPAPPAKGNKKSKTTDTTGEYIVNPSLLCNDRASLICGRCHHGSSNTTGPLGPPPGMGVAAYMSTFFTTTGHPPTFYADGIHCKGGHEGATYPDYLTSAHYRNSVRLVACDDCHNIMGGPAPDGNTYQYFLNGNPNDSVSGICNNCHNSALGSVPAIDVTTHVPTETGATMKGDQMHCHECHMPRTGTGGAGNVGLLLGTPQSTATNGVTSDANIVYYHGDQASHVFDVPSKFSIGTAGVSPPGSTDKLTSSGAATSGAMPVPYTNACGAGGACHNASQLQFQGAQ